MSAALTPGYTFSVNETVTNTKLGTLVSGATISGIDQGNMASGYGVVITSTSQPSNTNALWLDSSSSNVPKYYNGSSWVTVVSSSLQFVKGTYNNLAATWATNATATITADELIVEDTSNNSARIVSLSVTVNIGSAGANGLDTGAEAANTIYYLWVIRKSSDGTVAGLISASSSAPTMPSGYDQKALVSCVGNNNSSNFIAFHQKGPVYTFDAWASMATGNVGTGAWTSIDMTPANMTTNPGFVPSALSTLCFGVYGGSAAINIMMTNDNTVSSAVSTMDRNKTVISSTTADSNPWQFDILTADTLYWGSDIASAVVYLHGFIINKLS